MSLLRKCFDYLTGSSLTDDSDDRAELLQDILDRRWAILIASVCVAATAAVAATLTHSIWPFVWFLTDAALAAARWAIISRALRGTAPERRQFGYVLASLSLLWSSLFGFAMLLLVRSGDQGLFILASIMTVSVASAISSRNAPMPRTAILAISLSALPFLVATGLLLPAQKWIALVAGLPLLASLWSLTLQNHKILVRLIIAERRARLLANTDALTGLPNRLSFLRHQDSLSIATGAKGGYAYMCVDLDGFKAVNDNHGHPAGDLLLKAVAQRLKDNTRATDITFRIGGDEFIV